MFSLLQGFLPTTDFNRDFGEVFHNQYQPLILQACVPSVVRALMIVKESNSQISQQRPVDICLSHRKLQTLRLQNNAGIAIKNIVSTHHVYSAIFYHIIVLRVALSRMSQSRTYLELQLRTRTYSTILYLFITASNVIFLRPLGSVYGS